MYLLLPTMKLWYAVSCVFLSYVLQSAYFTTEVTGLHYFLAAGARKCFEEIAYERLPLALSYVIEDSHDLDCNIVIFDAGNVEVFKKEILPTELRGKVSYLPAGGNEFRVCTSCHGLNFFPNNLVKWTISFDFSLSAMDLNSAVKKTHISSLSTQMHFLLNRLSSLEAATHYEKAQEAKFKASFAGINSRFVWVTLLQMLVSILITTFVIIHLTRYFRSQKLI